MERIEYRNRVDKSEWGPGEWQQEPDKVQWQDDATGLPCLIVRGPSGALCGYVGVPEGHKLYSVEYSKCPEGCQDSFCDHRPDSIFEVHGGLTFSHGCSEINETKWLKNKEHQNSDEVKAQIAQYPIGDVARYHKEWVDYGLDDYNKWREHLEATAICHKAGEGEPDHIWWFGFDCAHAGDYSPAFDWRRELNKIGTPTGWGTTVQYRNIEYVAEQCRNLASQLAAVK